MLLFACALAQAAFLGGVAFVPPGVGALALSDADGFSGTLASEWDGWLRPPLTAHAGWVGDRHALLATASWVQMVNQSWAEEQSAYNVGGVRLGGDWRGYVWSREPGRVNAWGTGGLFGILPNASEANSGWTESEQTEADKDSADRRAAIGGLGVQGGLGAEFLFGDREGYPVLAIGARWVVRGFGALDVEETQTDLSMMITSEAALLLEFTR